MAQAKTHIAITFKIRLLNRFSMIKFQANFAKSMICLFNALK